MHCSSPLLFGTYFFFPVAPDKPAFSKSSNPVSTFFAVAFLGTMGVAFPAGLFVAAAAAAFFAATLACNADASFSFRFNGSPPYFVVYVTQSEARIM